MATSPGVSSRPKPAIDSSEKFESLGRLAAGVTHDFANLITVISGYAETISRRIHPADPIRAELDEIRRAAAIGSRLTDQLMNYVRELPAETRAIDLRTIIGGVLDMLRPFLGEEIRLERRLEVVLPPVNADPTQIEQAILNLVLNARDAVTSGGWIRVETDFFLLGVAEAEALEVEPGKYVSIRVTDNGVGMDAETLAHAFDSGFSAGTSGGHAGLGLTSVRRIARSHGGTVTAVSAPGAGSAFTLLLPC